MKLSFILLLFSVAAFMAPLAHGEDFDHLLDLITQLEEEAGILAETSAAKDGQIELLTKALENCETGVGDDDGATTVDDDGDDATTVEDDDYTTTDDDSTDDDGDADDDIDDGWVPSVGDSWNYNLATPVKTDIDVDVFLIDMDDAQDTIDTLHANGKVVVCYISIGSVENWRDDFENFPEEAIGNPLEGWEGERWLDVNSQVVRKIMTSRVEKAASMSCDGIEPDNMSVYNQDNTGVTVTMEEQEAYNRWFADKVHYHGMKVGLKNAVELIPFLVDDFDFSVNEECNEYDECDVYVDTFLAQDKPVFNVEYVNNMDMCDYTNGLGFDTIIKNYNLEAPFCSCVDPTRNWECIEQVL